MGQSRRRRLHQGFSFVCSPLVNCDGPGSLPTGFGERWDVGSSSADGPPERLHGASRGTRLGAARTDDGFRTRAEDHGSGGQARPVHTEQQVCRSWSVPYKVTSKILPVLRPLFRPLIAISNIITRTILPCTASQTPIPLFPRLVHHCRKNQLPPAWRSDHPKKWRTVCSLIFTAADWTPPAPIPSRSSTDGSETLLKYDVISDDRQPCRWTQQRENAKLQPTGGAKLQLHLPRVGGTRRCSFTPNAMCFPQPVRLGWGFLRGRHLGLKTRFWRSGSRIRFCKGNFRTKECGRHGRGLL